jgi:RimJ/RimL family protein N-acetyltransferase
MDPHRPAGARPPQVGLAGLDPPALGATSPRFGLIAESIDGAGIRIRRFRDDDVDDVRAGCDDPLTARFLPLLPSPYTREDAVWWVTQGHRAAFDNGGGSFVIADPGTDRLLGGVGITHQRDGTGEIGYWVAPWGRRRGAASAAARALSDYAFAAGYGRLQLRTEYENTASQRVAIAAGYTPEGVQREAALSRGGGRHDLLVWSRLSGDPPGPSPRLLPDLPAGQLTDGVVALVPLGPHDVADAHGLRSRPEVWATSVRPAPPSLADTHRAGAQAAAQWLAGTAARLTIRDAATGTYAGDISLVYHLPAIGEALLGYAVAPGWRGRGYATRAVRLIAGWALRDAGVARLTAGAAPGNAASQRVLERAGFVREGYQRGCVPTADGGRGDAVSYALLAVDLGAPVRAAGRG